MKKHILSAVLCAFMLLAPCVTGCALAANPEDALSAQPPNSAGYVVLRLDNLGELLRWIMSEENFKIFTSAFSIDEGIAALITRTAALNPAESFALLAGIAADKTPCLQIALAMPDELQPQLKLVSEGKAETKDILTLLLGKDTPVEAFFGNAVTVVPLEGGVSVVNDILFVAAHENLLLLSVLPDDLKASLAALVDSKSRLNWEHRFDTKNYALLHVDYEQLAKLPSNPDDENDVDEDLAKMYESLSRTFTAPLEMELAFTETPEKFVVNGAINVDECISKEYVESLRAVSPVKGGHIKLVGEGSPLFALGFSGFDIAKLDHLDQIVGSDLEVKKIIEGAIDIITSLLGLDQDDLDALMKGSISISLMGRALFTNGHVPGLTLTLSGENDIAASVVDRLARDDDLPLETIDIKGFDKALQAAPSLVPVSAILGVKGDTLVIGVMDKASIESVPQPTATVQSLLELNANSALFIDFEKVRLFLSDVDNNIAGMLSIFDEDLADILTDILDVELSVPSVSFYTPTYDTFTLEFEHAEINTEKGVWAKLAPFCSIFSVNDNDESGSEPAVAE